MTQNALNNSALQAFSVPKDVYNAIQKASAATGVKFSYLVEKAAVESNFDTNAKAKTSSASGLYQFIESTWLNMVNKHGDKYGLEKYADKISDNGKVSDPKARREILAMRNDPEIASLMAAELDISNYNQLKENVGGNIGSTELYMAHFLGAGGASGFLNAMNKSPNMTGADLFPQEARSNRNVFYDKQTGAPRSLKQIYAFFDEKFQSSSATTNFAANTGDTVLRTAAKASTTQQVAAQVSAEQDDPFTRLATLMGFGASSPSTNAYNPSPLRIGSADAENSWQIFPPSLYNRLSLSPAQMMMLSDFNA